jgi:2-polyprenyl-3-methyl-5-hydroxy-6-metoxy-1,4-benzoquinol methylase
MPQSKGLLRGGESVGLYKLLQVAQMSNPIGDSKAILDQDRLLVQHQAALTLLQSRVQNPKVKDFHWLDLACGRGQIIVHLDGNLTPAARGKISYHIYDVRAGYVSTTRRKADLLGFKSVSQTTDSLEKIDTHLNRRELFDFITFTNTVHELSPKLVASTLVSCVLMLKQKGSLFTRTAVDFAGRCLPHVELWNLEELQKCLGFPPAKSFKK